MGKSTFRLTVSSEGAEVAGDLSVRSITDTRVIFTPGKRLKQMLNTIEFQKESATVQPG